MRRDLAAVKALGGYAYWFNTTRLFGDLGMVPPMEYEESYYRLNWRAEMVGSDT